MTTSQVLLTIYSNRKSITKILKPILGVAGAFIVFLLILITPISAIFTDMTEDEWESVSSLVDSLNTNIVEKDLLYTVFPENGSTYTYIYSYVFPTIGNITQGWIEDPSGSVIGKDHLAIDISDSVNPITPVVAFSEGVIVSVEKQMIENTYLRWKICDEGICWYSADSRKDIYYGCGNGVVIKHKQGLYSKYCHLEESIVGVGDEVGVGQLIGIQGDTGYATGKHLHFEIFRDEGMVNGELLFNKSL